MKTTTKTGKIQKLNKKVQEEGLEAIYTISFFLKTFSIYH